MNEILDPATTDAKDDNNQSRDRPDGDCAKGAADLLRDASDCVGWDGRADMRRLLLGEFEHNARVVRAYAEARPDRLVVLGAPCQALLSPYRVGANREWRVGRATAATYMRADMPPLDDASAFACLAVSARYWSVGQRHGPEIDDGALWRSSWLSVVTGAIVDAADTLHGQVIMRTLALARTLLCLYDARARDHVLARLDDGDACQGDSLGSSDLARGIATYEAVAAACPPPPRRPCRCRGDCLSCGAPVRHGDLIQSTVSSLRLLASFLQRLYETPPIYNQIIAPAEYAGLCAHSTIFEAS